MAELEAVLEKRLIDQLCQGDSQWTYRPDIRTEEDLWDNFRHILEQNNKAKLDDGHLTDSEFAKIKNDLSHASFYDAGRWLVGENGQVYVHVQRGNETLHLLVLNNEHIAGGTSVYEVINQYQAFGEEADARDRRFDVTLLINGIPMIHIELKNKDHSYMDGFYQIKKYIAEGKFRGLFSNVQMFVVSNGVDTKYFSAARDNELNKKFLTGWIDSENQPVPDFLDFAKAVLKIPEAHEMVTKYIVLDNDKKKLLILRPYQIHAIEAMRDASKQGKSGFIWHTTGSGKTMTSYKATRNLLMDIPSIEKTIFLIDRKDLDLQTKLAFQSYANNDTIDVDETENVNSLIKKLTDGKRQMIVTTRQKMQTMVNKRLKEGTAEYNKIRALKVAFVVDECHRAVTPQTKRDLEAFFANSLWFGFTGTPIFEDNKYEQKGDLAQTTEQLYGERLHSYTIKEAIHDGAVLGFMVETLGKDGLTPEDEERTYGTEAHMRQVLNTILNKSYAKFGMEKGKGETYEAMFTVSSIEQAQKYYDFIKRIKAGKDELKISEEVRRALPDFPKVAITYSVTENEEASKVNQDKMQEALDDYKEMFGSSYGLSNINAYNANLNDRLARKEKRYLNRSQQLDIVIVVDRLLTGFDAPCLSTLFIDRQPMSPQNLIQAFSRTNRLFDTKKQYGQIVTFQSPQAFKEAINSALALYSRGGKGEPLAEDFETVKEEFNASLKAVRNLADTPQDVISLSEKQKKQFIYVFRDLDRSFNHLKAFSSYNPQILTDNHFSQEEYEDYAAIYKNVLAELKTDKIDDKSDDEAIIDDYELVAVDKIKVDYDYIIDLISGFVDSLGDVESEAEYEKKLTEIKEVIAAYSEDNPKLGALLEGVLEDIVNNSEKYENQDVSVIINQLRQSAIEKEIRRFSEKWFVDFEDVKYEAYHFKDGKLANENKLKEKANYAAYKEATEEPVKKFKFFSAMIKDFKEVLMPEIAPLFN
ncbi:type I restriction endonuclease subunit R [Streptococcus gallolyticus]|uniref:type I restriction endonuclease subunit R n=1 Tax=Streptococcus gallolyticus TaxID=315405 RepID=UPI000890D2BA|nr:type I restriction endonuclease subunit R [Streptococcus gallolyticus]SDJ69857.1 type I restriction enzyme, R subunit [Streptococcus gallolyticus]SDL19933.1 type I restriction enzyme, R subunit [Streptococcus gallolyticus]